MNIIVCVKQVPDTNEVRIDKKTNNLMREGVPGILNPYDQNSVEMALGIREKTGGKVTVVSMGPRQTEEAIQYCLDMGADEGILLFIPLRVGMKVTQPIIHGKSSTGNNVLQVYTFYSGS